MDIRMLTAAQKYAAAKPTTEAIAQPADPGSGAAFSNSVQDFAATLKQGEDAAEAAMTGDLDPHALVHALAQSELAVDTVVAVRDKVVEAYQEILRMPV